jgi:hypothetical protein
MKTLSTILPQSKLRGKQTMFEPECSSTQRVDIIFVDIQLKTSDRFSRISRSQLEIFSAAPEIGIADKEKKDGGGQR